MTNKDKFREIFGVELCYCGIHGKEGTFYIAGYNKYNNPYVITTTKQDAKDWLNAEYKPTQREEYNMNVFYRSLQMPQEFLDAVETIMKYCQNEDCQEDCKNCPYTLAEIRCGDTEEESGYVKREHVVGIIDEQLAKSAQSIAFDIKKQAYEIKPGAESEDKE